MEFNEILLFSVIMLIGTALFTGLWTMVGRYLADRRIRMLEADMESVIMTLKSRRGEEGRVLAKEEEAAFMTQAAAILQGEGDMGKKIQQVIALNPKLALKLASKMGIKL